MRPPRIAGFDYRGSWRYSLTCATRDRQPVFHDPQNAHACLDALTRSSDTHAFRILVHCVMPDHLHALVEGATERADFLAFVRAFRRRSAHEFRSRVGHELWQRGYWDRVLRAGESTPDVIRYIVANPVRAGLISNPLDYPFTGSGVFDLKALLDAAADAGRRG
jgi:putative transposase